MSQASFLERTQAFLLTDATCWNLRRSSTFHLLLKLSNTFLTIVHSPPKKKPFSFRRKLPSQETCARSVKLSPLITTRRTPLALLAPRISIFASFQQDHFKVSLRNYPHPSVHAHNTIPQDEVLHRKRKKETLTIVHHYRPANDFSSGCRQLGYA